MLVCHLFIPPPPPLRWPLALPPLLTFSDLLSTARPLRIILHLAPSGSNPLSRWLSSWLRPRETFHIPCNVCLSHLQSFVVCFGFVHLSIPSSSFEVSRWAEKCCVASRVCEFARAFAESQTTTSFFGGRTLRRNLGKGDGEISSHHLPPKKVSPDAIDASLWDNRVVKQPRSRDSMVPCSPCSSLVRGLAENFEVSRFPPRYISPLEDGGLDLISLPASSSTPKVCLQTASELTCYEGQGEIRTLERARQSLEIIPL